MGFNSAFKGLKQGTQSARKPSNMSQAARCETVKDNSPSLLLPYSPFSRRISFGCVGWLYEALVCEREREAKYSWRHLAAWKITKIYSFDGSWRFLSPAAVAIHTTDNTHPSLCTSLLHHYKGLLISCNNYSWSISKTRSITHSILFILLGWEHILE